MIFVLCNFGGEVTDQCASLGDSYYEMLWYLLPVDQQKYFILLNSNAQRPVYLDGFVVQCTREMFKQVRNVIVILQLIEIYF